MQTFSSRKQIFLPVTQENKMVNHQMAQIRRLFLAFKRQVTIRKIGLCCI